MYDILDTIVLLNTTIKSFTNITHTRLGGGLCYGAAQQTTDRNRRTSSVNLTPVELNMAWTTLSLDHNVKQFSLFVFLSWEKKKNRCLNIIPSRIPSKDPGSMLLVKGKGFSLLLLYKITYNYLTKLARCHSPL